METLEAIRTLLAVKSYKHDPVSDSAVRTILEAGRLSGSAHNNQPWHFVVVRDPNTRSELGARIPPSRYISDAPVAIGVFIADNDGWGEMDGARAIQSMLLAAWDLGLGSTWTSSPRFGEIVNPLLGVPEEFKFIGFVTIGLPDQPSGKGIKRRKPLSEIAHIERFGESYR
jgi:nitroreductase